MGDGKQIISTFPISSDGLRSALELARPGESVYLPTGEVYGNFTIPSGVNLIGGGSTRIYGDVVLGEGSTIRYITIMASQKPKMGRFLFLRIRKWILRLVWRIGKENDDS